MPIIVLFMKNRCTCQCGGIKLMCQHVLLSSNFKAFYVIFIVDVLLKYDHGFWSKDGHLHGEVVGKENEITYTRV